jgi:hypothetical protein
MPFVIQVISKIVFGFVADWAKSKRIDVDVVTKVSNSIASFGCAACLLSLSVVEDKTTMLVLLSASLALTAGKQD